MICVASRVQRWRTPALAANESPASIAPTGQSVWHINIPLASGTLTGVSPVAASVQMNDGTSQTFAISHAEYERLRGMTGDSISFRVEHDVLTMIDT